MTVTADQDYGLLIDGEERWAGESAPLFDPSTGEAFGSARLGGAADVDAAVAAAKRAFESGWANSVPAERGRLMQRLATAVRDNAEELAEIVMRNAGHPPAFARGDAANAARYFEYYGGVADKIHGESIPLGPEVVDFTVREPYGVCAVIPPFNGPLQMLARSTAPALAAGNTVVVKPTEQAPAATLALGRVLRSCELPPGVLNVVPGGAEAGQRLVVHDDVDHVTFTGSVTTGAAIMKGAGDAITPVTLELGGKSPQVVFDDADLGAAAQAIVGSALVTAGQVCSAGTRVLVQRGIHDELVDALAEAARSIRIGPPLEGAEMGPVISARQRERVSAMIGAAESDGARLVAGGREAPAGVPAGGHFVTPTLFDRVDPDSELAREEVFGPVLALIPFDDQREALRLANDSDFGLAAGVWSRDSGNALWMARELKSGQVFVNNYGAGGGVELPFGGFKRSGIGREKGLVALDEYTQVKNVCIRVEGPA